MFYGVTAQGRRGYSPSRYRSGTFRPLPKAFILSHTLNSIYRVYRCMYIQYIHTEPPGAVPVRGSEEKGGVVGGGGEVQEATGGMKRGYNIYI